MADQKVSLEIQILRSPQTRQTIAEIAQLELRLEELNRQLRAAKKAGDAPTYTRLRTETTAVKGEMKELNAAIRTQEKALRALSFAPGSYQELSAELGRAKKQFQALSREARDGVGGQDLLRRIQRLDRELKQIDASTGTFTRNVGNYASALRGVGGFFAAAGLAVGVSELVQAGRAAVKTYADFQQEIATLGAISGATGDELAALQRNAQRLGETTQFTAVEVAKLQTNFARIGLEAPEILAASEATANLAIATTESVERASEVMGAAINGFSLGADEAGRLSDVMTAAFNSTALSLEKWAEAQKFAATVATAAGISVEGTAAAMGVLADAGLEGSNIGTALRRIFSDLSTEGSKLSEELGFTVKTTEDFTRAMQQLSKAGIDNTKAFNLVGRIAQSSLIALVNRGDDIADLTAKFEAANGQAARTAAIVGDTLSQDLLKAKSAIEGLQINLVSFADKGLRGAVQGFTSLVDLINRFVKVPISEQLRNEQRELNVLVTALGNVNNDQERRLDLIAEIQAKYPAFLKNINLETASQDELEAALAGANKEYTARILLQQLAEELEEKDLKLQKRRTQAAKQQISFAAALVEARKFLNDENATYEEALIRLAAAEKASFSALNQGAGFTSQAGKLANQLRGAYLAEAEAKERTTKAENELTAARSKQAEQIEIIKAQFPEVAAALALIEETTGETPGNVEETEMSVKDLQARLADLRADLAELPEGSELYQAYADEIAQVEAALAKMGVAVNKSGAVVEKVVAGSLKALQKELSKLQADLENTPASSAKYEAALLKVAAAQRALNEEIKRREIAAINPKNFVGDPEAFAAALDLFAASFSGGAEELDASISALEAGLERSRKFQEAVKELRAQTSTVDVEAGQAAIEKLRFSRLRSLRAQLRDGVITEEQYNREKIRINEEADVAILQNRLGALEVGSVEYLKAVQEIADKEIEIQARKNAAIAEDEKRRRGELINYALEAADSVASALLQIETNREERELDSRLEALDAEYAAKFEAAQGNAALTAQLEAEQEEKRAALEVQAAERRKEIARKEAVIKSALAAIATVANLGFPAAIPALALQAVQLAAQLAVINSQEFARGGLIDGKGARGGKVRGRRHRDGGEPFTVRGTGQRVELEGGEAVINRRSMASREVLSVTGTPSQIASQINSFKGYGVPFADPSGLVRMVNLSRGGRLYMEAGGVVPAQPQFINPNLAGLPASPGVVSAVFTDEQIERLAAELAKRTARETGESVKVAINDANRLGERQKFATAKTGIK